MPGIHLAGPRRSHPRPAVEKADSQPATHCGTLKRHKASCTESHCGVGVEWSRKAENQLDP